MIPTTTTRPRTWRGYAFMFQSRNRETYEAEDTGAGNNVSIS